MYATVRCVMYFVVLSGWSYDPNAADGMFPLYLSVFFHQVITLSYLIQLRLRPKRTLGNLWPTRPRKRYYSRPKRHDLSGQHQGPRPAEADILSMRRVIVLHCQPIRFARFDKESVNRGLSVWEEVLEPTRGHDPWC